MERSGFRGETGRTGGMRLILAAGLFCLLLGCSAHATGMSSPVGAVSGPVTDVPDAIRAALPARVEEVAWREISPGGPSSAPQAVVVWSSRSAEDDPSSSLLVLGPTGADGTRRVVYRSKEEPLYGPVITVAPRVTYRDGPVIVVQRQAGAAWMMWDVLGGGKGFKPLCRLEGEAIEWRQPGGASDVAVIVHKRGEVLDIPRRLAWTGRCFEETSEPDPAFYAAYLQTLGLEGPEAYPPETRLDIAQLTALAGRASDAAALLRSMLHQAETGALALDPSLRLKVEKALKALERR